MDTPNFLTQPSQKIHWLKSCGLIFAGIVGALIVAFMLLTWQHYKLITSPATTNQNSQTPNVDRILVETTDDPSWGKADAKVVIVEFSDFECPYCRQEFPIMRELGLEYTDKVKFIYRDFLGHDNSQAAAEAAQCANEQGKFLDYHDKLFLNQSSLDRPSLKNYARQISIADLEKFDQCLDSGKYTTEVQQDHADAQKFSVTGTPTFFINGFKIAGAIPKEEFKQIIDEFLK